jgi:hypothetical protein
VIPVEVTQTPLSCHVSNPWDRPPLATHGDLTDAILYEWIGRSVVHFEHIEWQLARLYSAFSGKLDDGVLLREYGVGQIFRARLTALRRRAEAYFTQHCNQDLEGRFDKICTAAQGFGDRRNEVAHGVVVPAMMFPTLRHRRRNIDTWVLAPPYSVSKNFNAMDVPNYLYTSRELNKLILSGGVLHNEIELFFNGIAKQFG